MRAGALDRIIKLQRPVETQDSTGQIVVSYARYRTVWASVLSISGRTSLEQQDADRQLSAKVRQFTIRHLAGVSVEWRILYQDEEYDILAVDEIEKRGREHFMLITAELRK